MGVGSYFEKLITNLGKDLEKKERFAQDYTEHLIRNKPLSKEAKDMGAEIGMANLTVTPHTKLFRGILESLAGLKSKPGYSVPAAKKIAMERVLSDPGKEKLKNILYNVDRPLAERIKVMSPDTLSVNSRGQIARMVEGMPGYELGHALWKMAKKGADVPQGLTYELRLRPITQGGGFKTAGHEMEHLLETEAKYAPSEMLLKEAGGHNRYLGKVKTPSLNTPAYVRHPQEGNAEFMGRLRILGDKDPFVRSMSETFPNYAAANTRRYAKELENAMRYRQWKADKIKTYRESIAAQKSSMPAAEAKKAEKTLHQMGLFPYEKLPVKAKVSKVDEVLRKMGLQ